MPRRTSQPEPSSELNLAPIMNMVVILIPLLLLSVVFLKVGTINVTAPTLSPGPPSGEIADEPLNLTVSIRANGFHVSSSDGGVPPVAGCPVGGATICLDGAPAEFSPDADEAVIDATIARYDWPKLYNTLVGIKGAHGEETTLRITADADVPYAAIVRLMDVARFKLEKETYANATELWSARYAQAGESRTELFPDPVILP